MDNTITEPLKGGLASVSFWQALSLYSPLITMISILIFSIFSSAINKGLCYLFFLFAVSAMRAFLLFFTLPETGAPFVGENAICNTGASIPFTGRTYSTFLLAFTLTYFVAPMFILTSVNKTNMVNYGVIALFIFYIVYDVFMKKSMGCFEFSLGLAGDLLSGLAAGIIMALGLFNLDKISLLFINELNSNKEVCQVPSKQQFRCSVMKDGQIIGSSVSA